MHHIDGERNNWLEWLSDRYALADIVECQANMKVSQDGHNELQSAIDLITDELDRRLAKLQGKHAT